MNRKALKKGLIIFGIGFVIIFSIGFIGGYFEPPVMQSRVNQITQNTFSNDLGRFDYNVKNVASIQMKVMGNTPNKSYQVDQKYQKVADLATETGRFTKDEKKTREITKKHNALIQFEENTGMPGSRYLHLAIGVPPGEFDAMIRDLKKIGNLKSCNVNKTDKTNEFKELQGQRRSLEQTRNSLLTLKARGGRIDEYINLENRILEIEQQLQKLGVQLGDYDATNEFCTVKITLSEKAMRISPSIGYRIIRALEWTIKYYLLLVIILFVCGLSSLILANLYERLKKFLGAGGTKTPGV